MNGVIRMKPTVQIKLQDVQEFGSETTAVNAYHFKRLSHIVHIQYMFCFQEYFAIILKILTFE